MDPEIMRMVGAIAAGAAIGLKDDAAQAVRDAYSTVRSLLKTRYPRIDLASVEAKPESLAKQTSLAEDLVEAGAAHDPELKKAVEALLGVPNVQQAIQVVSASAPAATAQGVMFGNIIIHGVTSKAEPGNATGETK